MTYEQKALRVLATLTARIHRLDNIEYEFGLTPEQSNARLNSRLRRNSIHLALLAFRTERERQQLRLF